ncbi:MAG: aminoacyltransferase [Solobacterium sp.]|jgi:lipid II:glycine glycyltransferase (peptidoglycan interpeptide bridge formation enzyme)|nr:aminoacyltransferase [Solobacterium sp.]MCH4223007.1 aminoacyltransferase [Solobacterium sp.]
MKFVEHVDPARFDAFAVQSPLNHYSKTSPFMTFIKPEYPHGELLGVEDDKGNLIATAVMLTKDTSIPHGRYSYCQYGFDLDIADRELIRFFLEHLKEHARANGSFFLRMDFNITRLEHEKNGKVKEGGYNHEYVTDILKECGYTHLGYNYGYSGNWMSRYTERLDLDKPWNEVLKGIKRCNTLTAKNQLRDVQVHEAGKEELSILVSSQGQLSHQLGFKPKDLSWFERLWDCYPENVHYYVVTTNYHQAKLNLIKAVEEDEAHLKLMKDENKMAVIRKNIDAMRKEIADIEDLGYDNDKTVPLGAKFIIMQGVNVWNVNMYTVKTLMNFRGAFALHRYAIEDLYQKGAKTYDFEGISGSLDPKDEYYGQQEFKKSFGGDFLEFLGEFDAVLDEKKYQKWWKWDHLYRRIRRKLRYIANKKKTGED